jgi:hypothetical protein
VWGFLSAALTSHSVPTEPIMLAHIKKGCERRNNTATRKRRDQGDMTAIMIVCTDSARRTCGAIDTCMRLPNGFAVLSVMAASYFRFISLFVYPILAEFHEMNEVYFRGAYIRA